MISNPKIEPHEIKMLSITCYDQDKIIYLYDVQRCERAIDFEKERKAKEAAFSSRVRRVS